jgi:hypothetical protein
MLDPQLVARLRTLPVFAHLPPYMHERIAQIARVQRMEAGAVVFKQWEVARGFYLLISGQGQLVQQAADGTRRVLAVVNPGQYFNEAALTGEMVEQASFILTQASIVLCVPRTEYQALPTTPPRVQPAPPANPPPLRPSQIAAAQNPPANPPPLRPSQIAAAQNPPANPSPQRAPTITPASPELAPRTVNSGQNTDQPDPRYPWLNPGERIMLMTRRHWWKAARMMWLPALFFLALLIPVVAVDVAAVRLVLLAAAVLIPGGVMAYVYLDWRNDWLVITDQRVLRVEQQLIRFSIETQEVGLAAIQSVKAALPPVDPMARVLRYGDVRINTAGSAGNIMMDTIPRPERVKDYIFRQAEMARRAAGLSPAVNAVDEDDSEAFGEADTDPGRAVQGGGFLSTRFINARGDTVYRQHPIIWFRGVFLPLVVILGGIGVAIFGQAIPALSDFGPLTLVGGVFLALMGMVWFWLADWDWRNDLYIVSDSVITLLQRRPLYLQYNEDQVLLRSIHNIEAVTVGLFRSLLDYGDVRLLLLGDENPKVFRDVPAPLRVREEISRRQRVAVERAREEEERRNYEAIMRQMQQQGSGHPLVNRTEQPTQASGPYVYQTQPHTPPLPRRKI